MPGFYDSPILNSPYDEPTRFHALDEEGRPLDEEPILGRRPSRLMSAMPKSRVRRASDDQGDLLAKEEPDATEYSLSIVNEIRTEVSRWRNLPNERDWKVTPVTERLLKHWRKRDVDGISPFFCQVEAVETVIWLTEVARTDPRLKKYWQRLETANKDANPELLRLAMKMATGAGKTTVMAMLIAWHTLNKARSRDSRIFSNAFLLVAPGITIRDRLRVLLPNDDQNYYAKRNIVPAEMRGDMGGAKIVITNYHAFMLREKTKLNKVSRGLIQGDGPELKTTETEAEMVQRVASELMGSKNIIVINDEAHHCYRQRQPEDSEEENLTGDAKKEADENNKYARVWINGLEAIKRECGIGIVYDLSATPFFLAGSGYREGTLFPWVMSDFSLMDAIECGIVKLPRIPVADDVTSETVPVFRDLWKHIGKLLPKKGRIQGGSRKSGDAEELPEVLLSALNALYNHYKKEFEQWKRAGINVPPVFIVVCNNTATSELVTDWIAGYHKVNEDGEDDGFEHGNLELFKNFDENGNRLGSPRTLLIDSAAIESGGEIDANFKSVMKDQIERFKEERQRRLGPSASRDIPDEELLREVMNTVGEDGKLGGEIRCVVSVSMLTEGWDANTVTHVLGVRAFGTQLLCEQVVGRGLRRLSYDEGDNRDINGNPLFDIEYSNVLGIPFDFAVSPNASTPKPPQPKIRIEPVDARRNYEIRFPRVTGYRFQPIEERFEAHFKEDSKLELRPGMVGPSETLLEGIVGEGVTITLADSKRSRPGEIVFRLAISLLQHNFKDENGDPKLYLFNQVKPICRQWINEYLVCHGETAPWMLDYASINAMAREKIYAAITRPPEIQKTVLAVLDPYNKTGSTRFVGFSTTKPVYDIRRKSHLNAVVLDSSWEGEFARVAEDHPKVISFVKNQGMGFEVPYRMAGRTRSYVPDFIVQLDDGRGSDDPLNLIVEIKGYRGEDAKLKAETMETKWIPGVNNLRDHGRWAFAEFRDVALIGEEFQKLIDDALAKSGQTGPAGGAE